MTLVTFILQALLPVLLSGSPDGNLSLTYSYGADTYSISSPDGGDTWNKPSVISTERSERRNPWIALRSGMLIRPVQKGGSSVGIEASMDRGNNWMPFGGGIDIDQKIADGNNRPVLVPLRDGRVAMLMQAHGYEWAYMSV